MIRGISTAILVVALAGCSEPNEDAQSVPEGAVLEPGDEGAATAAALVPDADVGADGEQVVSDGSNVRFDPSCLITEDSVAGIAMPDTLGQFVSAFPADTVLSFYPTYMVDFGKLCLRAGGGDALCADFESYNVDSYDPAIEVVGLTIYAPQCRTSDGIGPGSSVAEAAEAYGAPTFSFNYDNEGREYVRFENEPNTLAFRAESATASEDMTSPGVPNGPFAGNYAGVDGDGSYFETSDYYPDGAITEVFVSAPFEPIE